MFGGMLSVRCVGGGKAAVMTTSMTKVWFPATSLGGGVESLVEHRKTVEGPSSGTPDDLLRLSVGLEHADDLYRDLSEALWGRARSDRVVGETEEDAGCAKRVGGKRRVASVAEETVSVAMMMSYRGLSQINV